MAAETLVIDDQRSALTSGNKELGIRLRRLRDVFGLSQRELAKRAGVTNSNISMLEQGQISPSVQSLQKILDVFPLSLADFFSDDFLQELSPVTTIASIPIEILPTGIEQRCLRLNRSSYICRQLIPINSGSGSQTSTTDVKAWLISGQLSLEIGGRVYQLLSGDAFSINKGQIYCVTNSQSQSAELMLVCS